jgi:hypothetical protein
MRRAWLPTVRLCSLVYAHAAHVIRVFCAGWLNDELINAHGLLLIRRSRAAPDKYMHASSVRRSCRW